MSDDLQTLLEWIDIPSVTGSEGDYADALARHLEAAGFSVERQEVAPGRSNVLARAGEPEVVLCTHLDTVPPWIAPRADRERVHGRGACDAKGPALAMARAARALVDSGEDRVGLLFTVGEEVDGVGAQAANERANASRAPRWTPRFTIVGEPTDNRFVRGHKGIFKARLLAHGVAGHSSQPAGPSAVHALVEALQRMLASGWGEHALFGPGTLNVGFVEGGVAPNVVAASAGATLLLRIVEDPAAVEARLRACLGERVELAFDGAYGPLEFHLPPSAEGEETPVVAFGTDAPFLSRWGERLLYGPGSIGDAHTDHENVSRRSFDEAVARYERTARELLARVDAEASA